MAMPLGFGADPVAGNTGPVMDDGDAAASDPVKEGGFADIRASDDGDESWHETKMLLKVES